MSKCSLHRECRGVPLQTLPIGLGGELTDPDHKWATTFGVEEVGAVLVRPDGYVAWRFATSQAHPAAEIQNALGTALAKQSGKQRELASLPFSAE
jgi:putative polyketide hydroxylase